MKLPGAGEIALFLFKQSFHESDRETIAVMYWNQDRWPEAIDKAKVTAVRLRQWLSEEMKQDEVSAGQNTDRT